jgi:MFS transporter, ACS family, D-galactonate transporter
MPRPVPTPATASADANRFSRTMAHVLALLAISLFINYIDRGSLSIAAPLLKDEFHLSATQLGILLSSFFWTYALFLIVSGWLVDRFNVNWVLAGGFLLWSVATAATGLAHTFTTLLVARLALGAGESVSYPACSNLLSRYFPEHRRGFANAAIIAGMACGPAFGIFAGGLFIGRFGWRPFFLLLGLASLLWLLPWLHWTLRAPAAKAAAKSSSAPSMLAIMKQRSAWGTCLGLFCMDYALYFLLTWLPFYLVRERHFSLDGMAKIGGAAYLLMAVCTTAAGWASDRWIVRGGSPTRVRKTVMFLGQLFAGVLLAACVISGPALAIALLLLASGFWGASASNTWAITQTLAGPKASGKWTGLQNFLGNLAGVAAPALTGFILDRTGHFFWAFAITAIVTVIGSLSWVFVVGPIEEIDWGQSGQFGPVRLGT